MNSRKDWKTIKPAPTDKTVDEIISGLKRTPKAYWIYYNQDKSIHHLRLLYSGKNGKKLILPLTYGCLDSQTGWHLRGPDKPFPLYNLLNLYERPLDPVLVVEGEKPPLPDQSYYQILSL